MGLVVIMVWILAHYYTFDGRKWSVMWPRINLWRRRKNGLAHLLGKKPFQVEKVWLGDCFVKKSEPWNMEIGYFKCKKWFLFFRKQCHPFFFVEVMLGAKLGVVWVIRNIGMGIWKQRLRPELLPASTSSSWPFTRKSRSWNISWCTDVQHEPKVLQNLQQLN